MIVAVCGVALLLSACGASSKAQEEQWTSEGQLLAWDGEVWIVDGQPIVVPPATTIEGQVALGASVSASGHVSDSRSMIADHVVLTPGGTPASTLPATTVSAPLVAIDGSTWTVGEARVIVPASSLADSDRSAAQVGSVVTIDGYRLSDGAVLAVSVEIVQPTAEPAASPAVPDASPTATLTAVKPTPTHTPKPTAPPQPATTPTATPAVEQAQPTPMPEVTATPDVDKPTPPGKEDKDTDEKKNDKQGKPHRDNPQQENNGNSKEKQGD